MMRNQGGRTPPAHAPRVLVGLTVAVLSAPAPMVAGCARKDSTVDPRPNTLQTDGETRSSDGVRIVYSTRGDGAPAVVLIHGGLANRGFWRHQLAHFSATHQVVAIDLAGHGQSSRERTNWNIAQFAADVRAVADHLALTRLVIVGNSLGGPVALEAAALLPGRAIGVVGIDTFHNATAQQDPAEVIARASAFEADPLGSCQSMVQQLFHPQGHAELRAWAEGEMCKVPSQVVGPMLRAFAGYDLTAAMRAARVPIRAVNGDLWPTMVAVNRTVVPDFEAIIMPGTGHYPMLEQPEAFNSILEDVVVQLDRDWPSQPR